MNIIFDNIYMYGTAQSHFTIYDARYVCEEENSISQTDGTYYIYI